MSGRSPEGYLRLFSTLDLDGNNSISPTELHQGLKSLGYTLEERNKFLKQFDLNGDGEISLDEYRTVLGIPSTKRHPRISKRQASSAAFMALFANCDSNRDGKVSKRELEEAFSRMNAPRDQIEKVIKQLDLNGDGIVTLGEYKVALGMTYEPVEAWVQLFKELDTDRSGDISREEIQAVFEESGVAVLKEAIEEWIAEHDRNGDGKLNYQEFMTFVGQQAEKPDSFG